MQIRAAFSILILVVLGVGSSPGQQQQPDNNVVGYVGDLQVIPNPGLQTVTVALTSALPISATSNQLVLVLQGEFKDYPNAWQGKGRLLVTHDYVGIVETNGTEAAENLESFKFSDRDLPPSVKALHALSVRDIYGIARYGEKVPLSPDQIQGLAFEGKLKPAKTDASDAVKDSLIRSQLTPKFHPNEDGGDVPYPNFCSGGEGASSCYDSSCGISCRVGYHAFCCDTCACYRGN